MFKPIIANMTHELKEEDKLFIDQKIADLKETADNITQTAKKVGIVLLVAVPAIILFACAAHAGTEIAIDKMTTK